MTTPANLIFIQSDNHNRQVAGCYGHAIVRTPTLDKIATRGVRFANSYCLSPLCCPARAAMATGRYPHQTGYWDNAIAYDARIPSWMHRLREQGHTVVAIGKLHYRSSDDDNGFTQEILPMHLHEGKGAVKNLLRGYDTEPRLTDDSKWKLYTQRSGVGATHYQDYDRQITAKAIEWLRGNTARHTKPWALKIGYISPHPPFTVPQRLYDLYPEDKMPLPLRCRPGDRPEHAATRHLRDIDGYHEMTDERMLRRVAAAYFGLITHLDEQIGAVMKVVEELGLLANTRIVYTSDHGELFGWHGLFGKKCLYEGAVGVPVHGPGRTNVQHGEFFHALRMVERKAVRDAAGTLIESYPRTLYASMGALVAARFHFDRGDLKNAKAQLEWVIERSPSGDFKDLARLRLAAVLLDEKAYVQALKLLDSQHAAAYDAQYAALKGDILVANQQPAEARAAYRLALEKSAQKEAAFYESVRMRLEALGD